MRSLARCDIGLDTGDLGARSETSPRRHVDLDVDERHHSERDIDSYQKNFYPVRRCTSAELPNSCAFVCPSFGASGM